MTYQYTPATNPVRQASAAAKAKQQQTVDRLLSDAHDLFQQLGDQLKDLQSKLPQSSDAQKQLAENLNPAWPLNNAATLRSMQAQTSRDLIDLQIAERMAQAYLAGTQWIETVKVPIAQDQQHKDALATRAKMSDWLALLAAPNQDQLEQLLDESATLAQQNPIAPDALIVHLELAVDLLGQADASRDLLDPRISRGLARNWELMLTHIDTANPPQPSSQAYLQRATDLLRIGKLLEEAYDLLAEDISGDSPLDVVNI